MLLGVLNADELGMLASTPPSPQMAQTTSLALSLYTLLFISSHWELIAVACCNDVAQQ